MSEADAGALDAALLPSVRTVRASEGASDAIELPAIPRADVLWRTFRVWIWAGFGLALFRAIPIFIVDYWFLDSLGRGGIFRTNFTAQLVLFSAGLATFGPAVALSVRAYAVSPALRRGAVDAGLWIGIVAGWLLARRYLEYLLAYHGGTFGETDPLFGRDIGFYVFTLPALSISLTAVTLLAALGAAAMVTGRYDQIAEARRHHPDPSLWRAGHLLLTRGLNGWLFVLGSALACRTFLSRYDLLFQDNSRSGVRAGADYLDVVGVFSTLNLISVSVVVEVGLMIVVGTTLYRLMTRPVRMRRVALAMSALLAIELGFYLAVIARDHIGIVPNEPTIQMPFIQRHIDATLRGYRLDGIATVAWRPPSAPVAADRLAASLTVKNAPILPAWVSSLEQPPDVQHLQRITASESTLVYGPMLQVYEQEQQLRPYYKFLSVDPVRYTVDGVKRMYASAVRELPSLAFVGPKEWLRYWGSAALMYTHGFGLVMSPVNALTPEGSPTYVSRDVPPRTTDPAFDAEPRVYFGEGAKDDYILTNIRFLRELDHATRQSRAESTYPADAGDGVAIRSIFRRAVLALYTGDATAFLFSRFIDQDSTRFHVHRTPLTRARRIAPFLFLDSNPYAFIAGGRVLWMVNGLTTTANYPYSFREVLGDKADERAVEPFPERVINYAEDSVKITIDAMSGDVRLYKIADDPIVNAWASIYPDLFERAARPPADVEAQFAYPLQWFHVQFDDIYKRYHQRHPIEFYNVEDIWDDADEVLGSIGRGLSEFGTTDEMTFSYEGYQALIDPADLPAGSGIGAAGDLQFALMMPFTPEGARNLRSLVVALQDPGSYGKLVNLRVAQGAFLPGPEQADTLIDNDAQVNQQITLWVRHGSEVVRGHTLLLPVAGDVLYVEPLWIMSLQNPLPQIKLFSVVYRGRTVMATSLDEAVRLLAVPEAVEQKANELPWFDKAQATGR